MSENHVRLSDINGSLRPPNSVKDNVFLASTLKSEAFTKIALKEIEGCRMDYIQSLVHSGFTRRQAEAQVMVLENYIKKLTTKEDLDGGLNSVRGEMRELRLELEKLKSEVAQLKKDFAELQTKVDQLKVEIKELRLMIHQMTYRIILSTAGLMTALAVIFRFLSGT